MWIAGVVAALVVVGFFGYAVWYYKVSGVEEHGLALEEKPGFRAVHWHANLRILVCDQERIVPANRGTPLLHTHRERNRIHIEGLIAGPQDVTLGKFMEAVEVPFGRDQVFAVRNGEDCRGKPGAWTMRVNGESSEAFENYAVNDGDLIELIFE